MLYKLANTDRFGVKFKKKFPNGRKFFSKLLYLEINFRFLNRNDLWRT